MIVFEQVVRGDEKKWIFFIHENNFIFSSPPWRFFLKRVKRPLLILEIMPLDIPIEPYSTNLHLTFNKN
jgi:hypothetical protein